MSKEYHRCHCGHNLSRDEEVRQHCDSCGFDWSEDNVDEQEN